MIANLILGIVCIFALLLLRNKELVLRYVFISITLFLAIRYNWGNDYLNYLLNYEEIQSYGFKMFGFGSYIDNFRNNEIGWGFINILFGKLNLGFFGLIIVLTVVENYLIYKLISKYVDPRYYWVAIFMYIMSARIFAVGASMIRQYFCICSFIYVVEIMSEKRKHCLIWSIIIVLLCSTIHRSNIVMLATLPLFYIKINTNRVPLYWGIVFFIAFVVWDQFAPNFFHNSILQILESDDSLSDYSNYIGGKNAEANSGLGVIFRYIMMIVWMFSISYIDRNKQSILIFYLFSYFFLSLTTVVPMFGRFTMYGSMFLLVLWPWLLSQAKTETGSFIYFLFAIQVVIMLKSFFDFYYDVTWNSRFFNYQTIFSAPSWM